MPHKKTGTGCKNMGNAVKADSTLGIPNAGSSKSTAHVKNILRDIPTVK